LIPVILWYGQRPSGKSGRKIDRQDFRRLNCYVLPTRINTAGPNKFTVLLTR